MRTGLLVSAVAGITAITGAAGYGAGRLTLAEQGVPSGVPSPLVSTTITLPSTPPVLPPALPDVGGPPALAAEQHYRARSFDYTGEPPRTLRLEVPREWDELLDMSKDDLQVKFRVPDDPTYWLRVKVPAKAPPAARARVDLRDELRSNGTRDLRVQDDRSGTLTSRIDGTQRRYEELGYTFTDAKRRRLLVLLRWVDGIEVAVTGRVMDEAGLRAVLERVTQTVRV